MNCQEENYDIFKTFGIVVLKNLKIPWPLLLEKFRMYAQISICKSSVKMFSMCWNPYEKFLHWIGYFNRSP